MNKRLIYTFEDHLKENLKDPEFRKVWEESEPEWHLSRQIIEARLKQNLSQRDLATRVQTSQAIISRIESGSANTSISLMKRFAKALQTDLTIHIPKSASYPQAHTSEQTGLNSNFAQAEKNDLKNLPQITKALADVRKFSAPLGRSNKGC